MLEFLTATWLAYTEAGIRMPLLPFSPKEALKHSTVLLFSYRHTHLFD